VSYGHFGTSAEVSGHFGTDAEVSYGHFGISAEMSLVRSVLTPLSRQDRIFSVLYSGLEDAPKIAPSAYSPIVIHVHLSYTRNRTSISSTVL